MMSRAAAGVVLERLRDATRFVSGVSQRERGDSVPVGAEDSLEVIERAEAA